MSNGSDYSNVALSGHFEFCQKKIVRSGGILGLFTGNKGGDAEHNLKNST